MPPSHDGEVHAPAPAAASDSDNDDPEEPEYEEEEEEEEEEEVEEYEEVEVYEEDEEDEEEVVEEEEEVEMDVSDSRINADEDRNDVSQDMESEGNDGQLRSGHSTLEKAEVKIPSNTGAVKESGGNFIFSSPSNEPLTTKKEESGLNYEDMKNLKSGKDLGTAEDSRSLDMVDGKGVEAVPEEKASKDHSESHPNTKAHLCNKEILNANTSFLSSINGNEMTDTIPMSSHSVEEANGVMNSKEMKQIDLQSGDDKKQLASRLAAPDTRTGGLSPGAEIKDGNDCPAVICDFFAKGWCIKGSSCRFLHIKKGDSNSTTQKHEADVASVNWKREAQLDEGLREISERSMSPGFPEPLASSVGNSSSHLETILPKDLGESQRWNEFHGQHKLPLLKKEDSSLCITPDSQQLPSSKDDPSFVSRFKDVGRDIQTLNWPADHASSNGTGSSMVRNSLLPEYGFSSSGSDLLSRNYHSGIFSSHSSGMEEMASVRSQHKHNDFTLPLRSHSRNLTSNTSLPTTGMLPSHSISTWTASSSPFTFSSFSISHLGSQKLLDGEKECHASRSSCLLQFSSPFPTSESKNLPVTNVPLCSAEHKTKFSSNDWEPSVPFRPSFLIPPMSISSPGSQYDPLRDSTESLKIGDESFNISLYGHGSSIMDKSHLQKYGESVLPGTLGPECNDDTTSVSSHNKFYDNVLDKSCHAIERDSLATEADTGGTSVDWKTGRMPKEENLCGTSHANDTTTKRRKLNDEHASSHQNDVSRHRKDLKLSRARQDNEMDVGPKMDGNVHKESKAQRHFRAALIDLVKELLKPKWRDGHLSKDAHNMIVKKVVDKVLSTLQSHQIPPTMELVEQYLSSFGSKITKLVEGYVDKYGKS